MKIVLVIPIYYGVDSIELQECLRSVFSQQTTYNFKVYIVKDGIVSNEVEKILVQHKDQICVLGRDVNMGLASILNYSLKMIDWDYYFRMDADDKISPNRIQSQMDFILENPQYHAVGSQFIRFVDSGQQYQGRLMSNDLRQIMKTTITRSPTVHASMLFKKSFFELNGYYNESFRYGCEDYDLFARAVCNSIEFTSLKLNLYYVRSVPDLKYRRLKLKNLLDSYKISLRYIFIKGFYLHVFTVTGVFIVKFLLRLVPSEIFQKVKDKYIK